MSYLSQFHHQIVGNAESEKKLVFLHGLMGSGANWRTIANAFASEYHILYYDQRGHGRSISPKSGYAPDDFARDLLQIIDELGWEQIDLVGHSMGGRCVAQFAYLFPQRVRRLVIEDIGPDANQEAIDRIEALLDGIPVPFADKKTTKEYFMNEFPRQFSERPKVRALGQFLYTNIIEKQSVYTWRFDPEAMRACVRQGRERDRYQEFSEISMPTLLIRGENSEELSPEVYQRVIAENPRIQGIEVAGAGHWVHFDQKEHFIELLQEFFSKDPQK